MTDSATADSRPAATTRILRAARALVAHGGAAEVSMGDVASVAEVSKALVHYHFHDKESLMRALVDHVGLAVVTRERAALSAPPAEHALDGYWRWLQRELQEGDVRVLSALAEYDSERVRDAVRAIAQQRRELAAEHVARLFAELGLTPRVPAALIAETVTAFIDGLATAVALDADRDPRPAFDVLWLALLSLTEMP